MQEAVGDASSTWLELLVARMHHQYPGLRLQGELATLMDLCTEAQPALGVPLLDLVLQLLQVWARNAGTNFKLALFNVLRLA